MIIDHIVDAATRLPKTIIFLEKGEIVPVICSCEHIYQPPLASESSVCPSCSITNEHTEVPGLLLKMEAATA